MKNECKVVSEGKREFNLHPQQTLLAHCYSLLSVYGFGLIFKLENKQVEDFFSQSLLCRLSLRLNYGSCAICLLVYPTTSNSIPTNT